MACAAPSITLTYVDLLSIRLWETNFNGIWIKILHFSEILIEIDKFSFKKIHLSAQWRPCCSGFTLLNAATLFSSNLCCADRQKGHLLSPHFYKATDPRGYSKLRPQYPQVCEAYLWPGEVHLMLQDLIDDKSTLVQVMAWCHQAKVY